MRLRRPGHRLALLAACLLQACGLVPPLPAPPQPAPDRPPAQAGEVIGRDREFVVVRGQRGDTLAALAERYLDDPRRAWWIAEFNNITEVRPGEEIVIPLKARNPLGIYAQGFQTVSVLCYHRFANGRSKLAVTPAAFAAQMEYLARNNYHVITLGQLRGFLQGREPLPRQSVVITIDDGYRSTYEIAYPILRKYGFPATVFLYSDFVGAGDALTWPQMQEMVHSGLIEIQPHSRTHSNLTLRLPQESDALYRERLRREVDVPSSTIEERLSTKVHSYAYPYGDTSELVSETVARRGIALGLTVTAGGNAFFAYPYMLRRTMIFGEDDIAAFTAKLAVFSKSPAR